MTYRGDAQTLCYGDGFDCCHKVLENGLVVRPVAIYLKAKKWDFINSFHSVTWFSYKNHTMIVDNIIHTRQRFRHCKVIIYPKIFSGEI